MARGRGGTGRPISGRLLAAAPRHKMAAARLQPPDLCSRPRPGPAASASAAQLRSSPAAAAQLRSSPAAIGKVRGERGRSRSPSVRGGGSAAIALGVGDGRGRGATRRGGLARPPPAAPSLPACLPACQRGPKQRGCRSHRAGVWAVLTGRCSPPPPRWSGSGRAGTGIAPRPLTPAGRGDLHRTCVYRGDNPM